METPTICLPNIGPGGRRRRMGFGVTLLALGGLAAAFVVSVHATWFWSLAAFFPFWMGGLGVLQAMGQT